MLNMDLGIRVLEHFLLLHNLKGQLTTDLMTLK
jgi:hypothetical protein